MEDVIGACELFTRVQLRIAETVSTCILVLSEHRQQPRRVAVR